MINEHAQRLSQAMSLPAIDEVPRLASDFANGAGVQHGIRHMIMQWLFGCGLFFPSVHH